MHFLRLGTQWFFKWILQVLFDLKPREYVQDFNQKFKIPIKIFNKLKADIKQF